MRLWNKFKFILNFSRMCVCVWDFIQTDKKDVVNFKLWTGMWSVSVRRSTMGYGGVSTREFGGPNWAHASFGKRGDAVGMGSGETWNSPLETIQGNSWVFIQYNTVTDQLTLSVQYMTSNTLHPVSTRKGGFGLERGGWWAIPSCRWILGTVDCFSCFPTPAQTARSQPGSGGDALVERNGTSPSTHSKGCTQITES